MLLAWPLFLFLGGVLASDPEAAKQPTDVLFSVRWAHVITLGLLLVAYVGVKIILSITNPSKPRRIPYTQFEGSYDELLGELVRVELELEDALHQIESRQAPALCYRGILYYLQKWSQGDVIWALKKQLQLKEDRIAYEVKTKYDYAQKVTRLRSELIHHKRLVKAMTEDKR